MGLWSNTLKCLNVNRNVLYLYSTLKPLSNLNVWILVTCLDMSPHLMHSITMYTYTWFQIAVRMCRVSSITVVCVCVRIHLHEPNFSGGTPILIQDAASGVPGRGSKRQLGSSSCIRIMGLDRAMVYSAWHRSFSKASHSSRQSWRRRGPLEPSSHRGKT